MSNVNFSSEKSRKNDRDEVLVDLNEKYGEDICRNAVGHIIWGFIFTIVTFNFWGLQYILPTIGVGLLYIGFRDLRNENKSLNIAWKFSIINMGLNVLNLININTPMSVHFKDNYVAIFILTLFQLSFLLIFRDGLKKIFEKINIKNTRDSILGLVIWRIIIVGCAITGLGSVWIIFIPLILWYFYICKSLLRLRDDLVDTSYRPSKVSLRISSKNLLWTYSIGCAVVVALCCIGSNNIKLEAKEFIKADKSQNREMLIDLGFPENILKDVSDEDVNMLQDAIFIESFKDILMFDSKEERVNNGLGGYNNETIPGKYNLEATTVYVELKDNRMYGLEYFEWKDGGAYWNDGFSISSSQKLKLINGRLLYEKNDMSYAAPIPRLKSGMIKDNDLFGTQDETDKITGGLDYPFNSNKQRGYIFYQLDLPKGGWFGCTILNYTHYNHPFRIPYSELEQNNTMFSNKLKQHYTNFQNKERHDLNTPGV